MTAAGVLFACAAVTTLLATTPPTSPVGEAAKAAVEQWSFDIFPLVGSMLAAAGVCLLHNVGEGKAKIAGRVIWALIFGFVSPWMVEMLPLTWRIEDPRGQMLIGVIAGAAGYVFSRYAVETAFRRAPNIAERVADFGEKKLDDKLKEKL